ncbi:extracellular solute-binding protein [Halomicrobium mukohataei]|uniref:Extracellular solute-binding protein family 1 n=2 Tax=Halomicrobium mukohataei TaxID=57705 RepID=C7P585_HALMD|nr:extracellular solute-binding protein [Halomicrobium mukohataei]ACV49480.1 extracellular solute-binding protein family 1 [Halomicrobium mukohataei DSM 12286]QCD67143.1 extracellular solute-binding protein [Halomicrobium mukohataei]
MTDHTRRGFLTVAGSATAATVAGCSGTEAIGGGGGETYEVGHGDYQTTVSESDFPSDRLYIYAVQTGWSNWGAVMDAFDERYGVELNDDQRTSGEALTHIRSNAENPTHSAYNGGYSFGITAMEEGFTTDYKPANWDAVPPDLKTDNGHLTATRQMTTAVTYRKDIYEERGLGEPESWEDFKHPDAAKDFCVTPPHSANGLATALSINNAYGGTMDDLGPVVEYYDDIAQKGADVRRNITGDFTSGEVSAVAQYDYTALEMKYNHEEVPAENVGVAILPGPEGDAGAMNIPYGYGMLDGAPNPETAKLFMDFVLSLEGQRLFFDAFVRPIRAGELEMPDEFPDQTTYEAAEFTVDQLDLVERQESIIDQVTSESDIPGIQG